MRDRPHELLEGESRSLVTFPPLLLIVLQDIFVLDDQSVALPQTELNHVGVFFEELSPQSIEFFRELCVQDLEFKQALGPLFVVHWKLAQTGNEGTDFLSKCLDDRIWRSLELILKHLAVLNVECL